MEGEIEKEKTKVYNRYLKDLELSEEDLQGKSVLDLGCGDVAPFIQKLKEKDLDVELRGIDITVDENCIPKELEGVIECGNFEEEIPGSYDYVLAYGSIFAYEGRDPESAMFNAVESLNPGGAIKIMPLNEPIRGDIAPMKEQWNELKEILERVAEEKDLQLNIESVDIKVSGNDKNNKDVWIRNLATLKKINKDK